MSQHANTETIMDYSVTLLNSAGNILTVRVFPTLSQATQEAVRMQHENLIEFNDYVEVTEFKNGKGLRLIETYRRID